MAGDPNRWLTASNPVAVRSASAGNSIDDYRVEKKLGQGATGAVHKVYALRGPLRGRTIACKIIQKALLNTAKRQRRVACEISLHKDLPRHPSIVTFEHSFEDIDNIYILTEYCPGSTLFSHLQENYPTGLAESQARPIFLSLVQAVSFLHLNDVLHRDLKLTNVLLTDTLQVRIADFGLATKLEDATMDQEMTMCGTPNYVSPEVVRRDPYGVASDVWSLGCMLVSLLTGRPPFQGEQISETLHLVSKGAYRPLARGASRQVKNLVDSILQVDPRRRLTIPAILAHPFVASVASTASTSSLSPLSNSLFSDRIIATKRSKTKPLVLPSPAFTSSRQRMADNRVLQHTPRTFAERDHPDQIQRFRFGDSVERRENNPWQISDSTNYHALVSNLRSTHGALPGRHRGAKLAIMKRGESSADEGSSSDNFDARSADPSDLYKKHQQRVPVSAQIPRDKHNRFSGPFAKDTSEAFGCRSGRLDLPYDNESRAQLSEEATDRDNFAWQPRAERPWQGPSSTKSAPNDYSQKQPRPSSYHASNPHGPTTARYTHQRASSDFNVVRPVMEFHWSAGRSHDRNEGAAPPVDYQDYQQSGSAVKAIHPSLMPIEDHQVDNKPRLLEHYSNNVRLQAPQLANAESVTRIVNMVDDLVLRDDSADQTTTNGERRSSTRTDSESQAFDIIGKYQFSTADVKPASQSNKHGDISISSTGEVSVRLAKDNRNYVISGDGSTIVVSTDDGGANGQKTYSLEELPARSLIAYRFASKFVNLARSKTVKIALDSQSAKCRLYLNDNFEVVLLKEQRKVGFSAEGRTIKVADHDAVLWKGQLDEVDTSMRDLVRQALIWWGRCKEALDQPTTPTPALQQSPIKSPSMSARFVAGQGWCEQRDDGRLWILFFLDGTSMHLHTETRTLQMTDTSGHKVEYRLEAGLPAEVRSKLKLASKAMKEFA